MLQPFELHLTDQPQLQSIKEPQVKKKSAVKQN